MFSRIKRARKILFETWRNPERTLWFKVNWTLGHSLRLLGIMMRITRMVLRQPSSFAYVFREPPEPRSIAPKRPRDISFRESFFTNWFFYWPHYSLTKSISKTELSGTDITVLVPIFGRLEVVRVLLNQLRVEQRKLPFKILIVDDRFDQHSTDWLQSQIIGWPDTEIIKNSENLGFLQSVNNAVRQISTKFVVVLNSDVELNSESIVRLVSPLCQPEIALATALATDSGSNLTISIPKGRHWKEVDEWLKQLSPEYPDAHTAVGYALAIDLDCVDKSELFSQDYLDGYGEDSDLHFRTLESGFRSVVVDNLLVKHHSGLSYQTKLDVHEIKKQNMRVFQDKWGKVYRRGLRKWEAANPINRVRGFVKKMSKSNRLDADVLVLIPSLDDTSGGGRMVVSLFEEIWRNGLTARISSTIKDTNYEASWSAPSRQDLKKAKFDKVISTGSGTFSKSDEISQGSAKEEILFFQGPEMFFDNGAHYGSTIQHLTRVSRVISVSPYLSNLATTFGANNVSDIQLGPDTDLYFRDEAIEKQNKVLISSRRNQDKGTIFSTSLALHFQKLGFSVETFGPTADALKTIPGLKHHGQLSAYDLNRLFNEARYVVDTSIFEGLGLVPLEALRAHCIPVTTMKGGLESIGIPDGWVIWLSTFLLSQDSLRLALEKHESLPNRKEGDLDFFFENRNLQTGISQACRLIANRPTKP